MKKAILALVVLAPFVAASVILWRETNALFASYIVAVAGVGAALTAIILTTSSASSRATSWIRSRVRVKNAKEAHVTGVSTDEPNEHINSSVTVSDADKSKVIGVRRTKRQD